MSTSESEGQVIGCHTDATWNEQLQKANENKKLVCLSLFNFWFFVFNLCGLGFCMICLVWRIYGLMIVSFSVFIFVIFGDLLICLLLFNFWDLVASVLTFSRNWEIYRLPMSDFHFCVCVCVWVLVLILLVWVEEKLFP